MIESARLGVNRNFLSTEYIHFIESWANLSMTSQLHLDLLYSIAFYLIFLHFFSKSSEFIWLSLRVVLSWLLIKLVFIILYGLLIKENALKDGNHGFNYWWILRHTSTFLILVTMIYPCFWFLLKKKKRKSMDGEEGEDWVAKPKSNMCLLKK